ncbi:MAG TPA: peptide MFS transporter [Pyrinomonadaceae bacterium]|nr:peptide MFS transporter [Pyrinomonadaceae bacterium]
MDAAANQNLEVDTLSDNTGIFGHPRGLSMLFFTEFWERFSYYGMRSILILYMTATVAQGGLGFDVKSAATLYGSYTMWVYLTGLPGGLTADRLLGAKLAVLLGGIVIVCGHVAMVFHSMPFFYGGLTLIAIGTGLLKPNISTMVGSLYSENDPRRDSGFSIFYMGINVGALLAPLCVGYLAQGESFKHFLTSMGLDPAKSWHWGFGAAAVGMTLGLIVYLINRQRIAHVGNRRAKGISRSGDAVALNPQPEPPGVTRQPLTRNDWKRIGAIFVFFLFTILFWAAYEQKGASLNLFTKSLVRTEAFGMSFPSSWLQSCTPAFVIILAPIFSILWVRLGDRQPSSPVKFTLGLVFIGLAYCLLVPAAWMTGQGRISPLWLVGLYFLEVVGEMCLSPVGLSTVTKLAPVKLVGIMMGVWFLAASFGNKVAGYLSTFFVVDNPMQLVKLYGGIALGLLISAGVLALLTPQVKKLMGTVN